MTNAPTTNRDSRGIANQQRNPITTKPSLRSAINAALGALNTQTINVFLFSNIQRRTAEYFKAYPHETIRSRSVYGALIR